MGNEITKNGERGLSEKRAEELFRPGYAMKVAKKLNGPGWFAALGMYTLGVCALTIHFMDKPVPKSQDLKVLASLSEEVQGLRLQLIVQDEDLRKERNEIRREMRSREKDLKEEIQRNIDRLGQTLRKEERSYPKQQASLPRSVAATSKENGKVLVYNEVNKDVLQKKQEIELKRLKKELEERKNAYLSNADLTDPEQQKLFADLKDDSILEIERLRSTHNEQLTQFRKQSYIVMD